MEPPFVSIKKHARSYLTKAADVLYYITCAGQKARDTEGFPSGQRGQTVNLLSVTSMVRIHLPPPINLYEKPDKSGFSAFLHTSSINFYETKTKMDGKSRGHYSLFQLLNNICDKSSHFYCSFAHGAMK